VTRRARRLAPAGNRGLGAARLRSIAVRDLIEPCRDAYGSVTVKRSGRDFRRHIRYAAWPAHCPRTGRDDWPGKGSTSKTSSAAPAIAPDVKAWIRAPSSTIGPARGVDSGGSRASSARARRRRPARGVRFAQDEVDGEHIGLAEQLVLRDQCRPRGLGGSGASCFWLQADDLHAKGETDACNLSADIAQGPSTPSTLPSSSRPTDVCQPPSADGIAPPGRYGGRWRE